MKYLLPLFIVLLALPATCQMLPDTFYMINSETTNPVEIQINGGIMTIIDGSDRYDLDVSEKIGQKSSRGYYTIECEYLQHDGTSVFIRSNRGIPIYIQLDRNGESSFYEPICDGEWREMTPEDLLKETGKT